LIDACEGLDASPAMPIAEALLLYLNSRIDAVLGQSLAPGLSHQGGAGAEGLDGEDGVKEGEVEGEGEVRVHSTYPPQMQRGRS
jgi:hypothetical protein